MDSDKEFRWIGSLSSFYLASSPMTAGDGWDEAAIEALRNEIYYKANPFWLLAFMTLEAGEVVVTSLAVTLHE